MSDIDRLTEMIGKLRAQEHPVGEPRRLQAASPDARLAALLAEVSETVLPRRISFQGDDDTVIHLGVANRRLQGVLGPSAGGLGAFEGKALSDPESDEVIGLKDALLGALSTDQPYRIRARHLGKDDLGSDAGLSSDALRRAWGLDGGPSDGAGSEATLESFLKALGSDAVAWLRVEGEEIADQSGSDEDVERLSETAAYVLDAYLNKRDLLFDAGATPRMIAIGGETDGVLFADMAGESAFVLSAPKKLSTVVAIWRGSFT